MPEGLFSLIRTMRALSMGALVAMNTCSPMTATLLRCFHCNSLWRISLSDPLSFALLVCSFLTLHVRYCDVVPLRCSLFSGSDTSDLLYQCRYFVGFLSFFAGQNDSLYVLEFTDPECAAAMWQSAHAVQIFAFCVSFGFKNKRSISAIRYFRYNSSTPRAFSLQLYPSSLQIYPPPPYGTILQ